MAAPTRFPSGVTTVRKNDRFGQMPIPDPTKLQVYFNDFHAYSADDWLETVVDTNTDNGDARTIDATAGGVLNILNNDNASDSTNIALGGTGAEPFLLATGKRAWLGAKFSSTDVDKNFLAVALVPVSNVDLQGGLGNDHVAIKVDGTDANIDVSVSKDGTATTSAAVGTVSDYSEGTNDLTEVVLYYNGADEIEVWVDNAKVDTLVTDNWPDDEEMTLQMEIHNTDAAADAMAVDWVLAAVER